MTTHAEEGALLRWVDDECAEDERDSLKHHLAECVVCRGRVGDLRDWTAQLDIAVRAARRPGSARRRSWRSVGVAAVLLLGIGLAAEPVRAWVLDTVEAAWSLVTGRPAHDGVPDREAAGPSRAAVTTSVTFPVAGDEFVLDVASQQRRGRLVVAVTAGRLAAARVVGGGSEDLLVLPDGIRIRNTRASTADYEVLVPPSVAVVRVTVAGEPSQRLATGDRGRWEIPLSAGGDRNRGAQTSER